MDGLKYHVKMSSMIKSDQLTDVMPASSRRESGRIPGPTRIGGGAMSNQLRGCRPMGEELTYPSRFSQLHYLKPSALQGVEVEVG